MCSADSIWSHLEQLLFRSRTSGPSAVPQLHGGDTRISVRKSRSPKSAVPLSVEVSLFQPKARLQSSQVRNSAPPVVVMLFCSICGLGCDQPAAGSTLALRNACPGLELWVSPASRDVRSASPSFLRNLALHGYERALENREV
jgi:hypothetical protein